MKIAIVEDHLMTRDFVRKVCLEEPDLEVVAEASTGYEAVERILQTHPDVVVLDIGLPDFDGIEVLSRVRENGVRPKALILSSNGNPYVVFRIEQAAVQGFVDKREQTADTLRFAIRSIRSNRTYFSESFNRIRNRRHLDPFAFDKLLTNQQMLVLAMVADLISDEKIASSLAISERTVEAHRTAIMRKLGVHSRTELILFAKMQGFTSGQSQSNLS